MNGFTARRAVAFASCLLIMGQSPHCSKEEYVDYQVRLQSCPDEAFRMPDSVVDGEFKLYSSDREVRPQCHGFRLYDYHEDRKGLAVPDVVRPDVRVRFERGESCRLHIVMGVIPGYDSESPLSAQTIAKLVMHGSPAQPGFTPATAEPIGDRDVLEYRCARQRVRAGPMACDVRSGIASLRP